MKLVSNQYKPSILTFKKGVACVIYAFLAVSHKQHINHKISSIWQ